MEWCDASYNTQHAYNMGLAKGRKGEMQNCAKLTEKQVLEIRDMEGRKTHEEISQMYNVHRANISYILLRKTWKHI